jgi:membrane protein DedA with SNARE-associated domain
MHGKLTILDHIVADIAVWITHVIAWLGYAGITAMMVLESMLMPVPSEVVMPFAGYLAADGRFNLFTAVLAGAIGCNIGSTVIYYLGAEGGHGFVRKWGHYFFLNEEKIARVEGYFHRWGGVTLLVARTIPFLPPAVSLPAGFARMRFWKFQLYTFIGCALWCLALAVLGYEFGLAWKSQPWVKAAIHWIDIAVLVAISAVIVWFIRQKWSRKRSAD